MGKSTLKWACRVVSLTKAIALFSGGKDSFLSMQIAMESGYEIVSALTVLPEEFSMMFHYPNASKSVLPAELLDVPVKFCLEGELYNVIRDYHFSGVDAIVSGAIASDYQKTRIERICTDIGLISFTPLWRKNQESVLEEILNRGIKAMIVSVSAEGLTADDLGRTIDIDYVSHLKKLSAKRKINIAGEGGEYETFVYGIPGKQNVVIKRIERKWEGSYGYIIVNPST